MNPETFSLAVAVVIFASGLLGLALQRMLPEQHTTGPSRDMIGAVVGLLTLLCALVTGLLIWTAYGVYAGQNTAIQTMASKALQLDLALQDYGPETKADRMNVIDRVEKSIAEIWGRQTSNAAFAEDNFLAAAKFIRDPEKALGHFEPATDDQRQALARATAALDSVEQSRLQMAFALASPISYPLLLIVVGWVVFLFCGFGLMSKGAPMSIVALAVGAIAVASAVLLILDLSSPYLGIIRASPAPLEQALAIMKKQ
jgi:hypothetical protein